MLHNSLTDSDLTGNRNFAPLAVKKIVEIACEKYDTCTLLDVGGAFNRHGKVFAKCGIRVSNIETQRRFHPTYLGDYNKFRFEDKFDIIWCNHVLEHQVNVNMFLSKLLDDCSGYVVITVPRQAEQDNTEKIVEGHVTWWNAGLLLYNMILAGFDCSEAMVCTEGYNITVICKAKRIEKMPEVYMDRGDFDLLDKYFPNKAIQGFDGNIRRLNW